MKIFILSLLLAVTSLNDATLVKEQWNINVLTHKGEVTVNGTLSLTDHAAKSRWVTWTEGIEKPYETKLTESEFKKLWSEIPQLSDLKPFLRANPDEELSFVDHHVVTVIYSTYSDNGRQVYWIPRDCKSKAVLAWLKEIDSFSEEK